MHCSTGLLVEMPHFNAALQCSNYEPPLVLLMPLSGSTE
jgi:hypothetical protein